MLVGFGSYSQGISICNKSLINFFLIVNMLQAKGGKSRVMQESSEGKINITGHSVIQQELLLTFCYTFRLISMMCLQLRGSTPYKCFLRLSFHLICHYVSSCLGILQHSLYNQVSFYPIIKIIYDIPLKCLDKTGAQGLVAPLENSS